MNTDQRIIELLQKNPDGMTLDQLTDALQVPKDEIAFYLGYLRGQSKKVFVIQWAGTNNTGKTCNLYKLNP
jgi:predicted ArsR family transcriptional regulator